PHEPRDTVDDRRERARRRVDRRLGHHRVEAVRAADGYRDMREPGIVQGTLCAVDARELATTGRRHRQGQRGEEEERPPHWSSTRSSRWTISVGEPSGRSEVRRPAERRMTAALQRTRPLAKTVPDASAI